MTGRFASYDGTQLGIHVRGDGPPLVCLPGGPGRGAEYLGDLGGLDENRRLILLDPRGVGLSDDPADPATFRVDRMTADVDALRRHLGLERMDLLAHSAGAILATLYAAAHPDRIARLVLVTPGLATVGVDASEQDFQAVLERRSAEPWYPAARAALAEIQAGSLSVETFAASRPLFYGRWDDTARAHATAGVADRHQAERLGYFDGFELDPDAVSSGLSRLGGPTLLYAGDEDPLVTPAMVRQAALLFPDASVVVQPGAGHFPWVDDPAAFAAAVRAFLA
ncbi:MAG: alpha/beta hydrolase [Actinobacteria bacterium]|nr:alpha/beta hydrolase [Actinomycetota bacterium]